MDSFHIYRLYVVYAHSGVDNDLLLKMLQSCIIGACHDIEDENFSCSDYDKYNLCNATSGFEYDLGHTRCQKHCGFCPGK